MTEGYICGWDWTVTVVVEGVKMDVVVVVAISSLESSILSTSEMSKVSSGLLAVLGPATGEVVEEEAVVTMAGGGDAAAC